MKLYTWEIKGVNVPTDNVDTFISAVAALSERTQSNVYMNPERSVCLFNARSGVLFIPQKDILPKGYNVYTE